VERKKEKSLYMHSPFLSTGEAVCQKFVQSDKSHSEKKKLFHQHTATEGQLSTTTAIVLNAPTLSSWPIHKGVSTGNLGILLASNT
jgi:hypothetical protein